MPRPKKSLSQNFLIDDTVVQKFVSAADIQPDESVLEIGPGKGAITKVLLEKKAIVTAIELDTALANRLKAPHLTVIEADALHFDYTKISTNKIVANLPFQIATPLILKLIQLPFKSLTVIVQKEVAHRLTAQKSTKAYGALTVQTQNFCAARYLFTIPPEAFSPKPKIDAAAIQLILHPQKFDIDFDFVFTAFRQRRKMLKSSLKKTYPDIEAVMLSLDIDLHARPENLTLEQFNALYKKLFA